MKIKPHILQILSPDKLNMLQTCLQSLKNYGETDFFSTVIINSTKSKSNIPQGFFPKQTEVVYDDAHFDSHPPTRWFIEPKSEVCLFLDYDIVVQKKIQPILEQCINSQSLCGVLAYKCKIENHIFEYAFDACGVEYKPNRKTWIDQISIPRYYNYGVLAIPAIILEKMKHQLKENVNQINYLASELNNHYLQKHAGQVALSATIEQLKIPTKDLPLRYNFPDLFPELTQMFSSEVEKTIFKHVLSKSYKPKNIISYL